MMTRPKAFRLSTYWCAAAASASDQQCLACHSMSGLEKPLANGGTLSLHISGEGFGQSVHASIGCSGCHTDINIAQHPPAANPIASQRVFSVAMVQVCRACHADKFEQWGKSVHATLVRDGNPDAPICTSCHSPHAMMKGAAGSFPGVPCKTCHRAIFTAYGSNSETTERHIFQRGQLIVTLEPDIESLGGPLMDQAQVVPVIVATRNVMDCED